MPDDGRMFKMLNIPSATGDKNWKYYKPQQLLQLENTGEFEGSQEKD